MNAEEGEEEGEEGNKEKEPEIEIRREDYEVEGGGGGGDVDVNVDVYGEGEYEGEEGELDISGLSPEEIEKLLMGGSLSSLELEDLFNKNTESFRCLAQMLISRSSLLRHPLYHFPPLEDPNLDEVFYYVEPIPEIDNVGVEHYVRLCKKAGIVPLSRVKNKLPTEVLDLTFYGLVEDQVRAITDALKYNDFVTELTLQETVLTPMGVKYLTEMLFRNHNIKILNLRECRIAPEGAANLSDGLAKTTSIYDLDLSFCSLGAEGIELLEDGLSCNTTIVKLNLSHNLLGEESAQYLATIFNFNRTIRELDLSWNDFYTGKGNKILFAGLSLFPWLRSLSLAWNGIKKIEAVTPIFKYLKTAVNLNYFDISNNRLTELPLKRLRMGLTKCKSLEIIKMGNNLIKPEEVPAVIKIFKKLPNLQHLDLENTLILKTTEKLLKKFIKEEKTITIGGILSNYEIQGPDIVKLLFDRANFLAKKSKKKDFGHFILKMPEESMTPAEFILLFKPFKMKKLQKDKDLIDAIAEKFAVGKARKVNLVNMKASYMSYFPDTELPPKKPKKKKGKGKKGKKGKGKKGKKGEQPAAEGQPPVTEGAQPPVPEGEQLPPAGGEQPPTTEDGQLSPPKEGEQPPAIENEKPLETESVPPPLEEPEEPPPIETEPPPPVESLPE